MKPSFMLDGEEELEIPDERDQLSEEQSMQLMEQFTQELDAQAESNAHDRDWKNIFFIEYACDEASQLSKFAERKGWELSATDLEHV